MKISRLRPWGALALGVSICSGLVSTARVTTAADSTAFASAKKPAPLDSILRKLKLDSDQKTAIKTILDAANVKIKALAEDTTLTTEEKHTAHKEICGQAFAAIRELLDSDQKATFDEWLASQPKPEDKPKGDKPKNDKPKGDKPINGKPGGKPGGEKPGGGKPGGGSGGDCDKPGDDNPKPKPTATPKPTAKPTPTYPTTGNSGNTA